MWVFLVTEIMFFGGLFMAYLIYRHAEPEAFQEASAHLNSRVGRRQHGRPDRQLADDGDGGPVGADQRASRRRRSFWLVSTMILGAAFLGVKAIEYTDKFTHHLVPGPNFQWPGQYPAGAEIFYSLYFCMTGLHAVHMIIGLGIMTVIAIMAWRGKFDADYYTPVEVSGLYWHFVDIVWIFLFPLLYLIGAHYGAGHCRTRHVSAHIASAARLYYLVFVALIVGTGLTVCRGARRLRRSSTTS